jgi:hypothetical protein
MKFGQDVMPLDTTPKSHIELATVGNRDIADSRYLEVGAALVPLNRGF